jgi:hypothetical protein
MPTSTRPAPAPTRPATSAKPSAPAADHEILFQQYFKSVGPRTYAAQVKRANNGNHYLVLTEGKRDVKSGDVRKCRVFVYSEDFAEFFRLVKATAEFIKSNPLPDDVKQKREKFWAKQRNAPATAAPPPGSAGAARPPGPATKSDRPQAQKPARAGATAR